ncbi:MAG: Tm-1-like ATP-binding domain-containing protein [Bryobacteraceae bacterium]
MKPRGPVVLMGTLDTKGEEIRFLKEHLTAVGIEVLVVDVGVLGAPAFAPDVSREQILACTGERLADGDRGKSIAAMERGLAAWCRTHGDRIAGMLAVGGSAGTSIATAGMREVRIGVPKLMVSTMASGNTRPYVGTSDIAMLYPVGDFTGLNRLTRSILVTAANAMAGMCSFPLDEVGNAPERPVLAATMFGVTTPCVNRVRELLEAKGFEILVFHATGSGGEAMERLVRDGFIEGVLDVTTTELADELVGGVLTAGPRRLEAAGERGVPQVISVGAMDMVNFGPPDTIPSEFRGRLFYQHNSAVTLMRTTARENAELGRIIATKANGARGPVSIVLPLRGVSAIDAAGQPFFDAEADGALFDAIRRHAKVKVMELDAHINDAEFAAAVAEEFLSLRGAHVNA